MSRPVFYLILCVALLFVMGLLMIYNTTSAEVIDFETQRALSAAVFKQLIHGILGIGCGLILYRVGYQKLIDHIWLIFIPATIVLAVVLIPGIGTELNGARRWLALGPFSYQPSEFMKFIIPLYAIAVFAREGVTLRRFLIHLGVMSIPIFLILIEPDNGTAAILFATLITLFFLTGIRWVYWAVPIVILCTVGGSLALKKDHVRNRIAVYLNPELDLLGKGHQPYQAKIATGSGGLYGRGLGESLQKFSYLPEARSDYIAAIYAEEFGFLGILVLSCLYAGLACLGFYIASHAKDVTGLYLATILTFLITFQAFLNLGVVSGLLPSKGTNLPFFSHGGSSLIANFMIIALLCSVSRISQERRVLSHAKL